MSDFKFVVPIRNCEYELNNKLVTVLFKKEKPSLMEKLIFRNRIDKPYKIDLDEIGSFVWELCDGSKNVEEITKLTKNHFEENIENVEARVELFVKQLHRNKLILLYEKQE